MNPIEPDDRLDALLRAAMHDEAETVMPAGDGLSRIQQRVAARRSRLRWMRPAMVTGSAAAVALAGVGAYAVVHGDANGNDTVIVPSTQTPRATKSTAPTPSATTAVPVSATAFPQLALYPFTTKSLAQQWQRGYTNGGAMPWVADAKQVALNWMADIVQQPSVNKVTGATFASTGDTAAVTLGRTLAAESHQTVPVTIVHEVKYGDAWIVTGATDGTPGGQLKFSAPRAGATVTSPLTVSGPGGWGVEPTATIEVRGADSPAVYGTDQASWGQDPPPWMTNVTFSTPTGPVGMVVALMHSQADSGPERIAVEQVRFANSSSSGTAPTYFYAVKDDRVAQFHSGDGSSIRYLSPSVSGGVASDPQLVGTDVYYVQGGGTCASTLMKIGTAGGAQPQSVASPDSGYVISSYAVLGTSLVTYYETACSSGKAPQAKLVTMSSTGQRHVIKFPSAPPMLVGDPSFELSATKPFVDAIVNMGNQHTELVRYNAMHDTSPTPGRNACPGYDPSSSLAGALQVDASGTLWFAAQTGSSMQVEHCTANRQTAIVDFTVPGNRTPADISVDNGAVLVTDNEGNIWSWDGNGDAAQLHPSAPLTQITW